MMKKIRHKNPRNTHCARANKQATNVPAGTRPTYAHRVQAAFAPRRVVHFQQEGDEPTALVVREIRSDRVEGRQQRGRAETGGRGVVLCGWQRARMLNEQV